MTGIIAKPVTHQLRAADVLGANVDADDTGGAPLEQPVGEPPSSRPPR